MGCFVNLVSYHVFCYGFGVKLMTKKRCIHYSLDNLCCSLLYKKPLLINQQDIDKKCGGYKDEAQCAYYVGYHLDIAGNDKRLKRFRDMARVSFDWLNGGE